MTVKIKNKKLYDTYKNTMVAVSNRDLTLTETLKMLSDYIILNDLTRGHDDEIAIIVEAIINGKKVELVGQKFLIYVPLTEDECAQYVHGWSGIDWAGNYTAHLYKDDKYQFTQYEIDELKKKYPYIKTKEADD